MTTAIKSLHIVEESVTQVFEGYEAEVSIRGPEGQFIIPITATGVDILSAAVLARDKANDWIRRAKQEGYNPDIEITAPSRSITAVKLCDIIASFSDEFQAEFLGWVEDVASASRNSVGNKILLFSKQEMLDVLSDIRDRWDWGATSYLVNLREIRLHVLHRIEDTTFIDVSSVE